MSQAAGLPRALRGRPIPSLEGPRNGAARDQAALDAGQIAPPLHDLEPCARQQPGDRIALPLADLERDAPARREETATIGRERAVGVEALRPGQPLAQKMRPIVDAALADAGAVQAYQSVTGEYRSLPLVGGALDVDLTGHVVALRRHVVAYAEKGIFGYLGRQEAAVRTDPAARTTELLRSVFGG